VVNESLRTGDPVQIVRKRNKGKQGKLKTNSEVTEEKVRSGQTGILKGLRIMIKPGAAHSDAAFKYNKLLVDSVFN
jgi:hypothetical protein